MEKKNKFQNWNAFFFFGFVMNPTAQSRVNKKLFVRYIPIPFRVCTKYMHTGLYMFLFFLQKTHIKVVLEVQKFSKKTKRMISSYITHKFYQIHPVVWLKVDPGERIDQQQ